MSISLVIPCYSAGPNIERTIKSCEDVCDDVVMISTAPYAEDVEALKELGTVVELPFNFTFIHGFGSMMNQGTTSTKNDWILLFGVAETLAQEIKPLRETLDKCSHLDSMFRVSHEGDINVWKRIWNRKSGSHWSGLIHEEIVGGTEREVLIRMQDTEKVPVDDPLKQEVFRYIKTLSYNAMYHRLIHHPEQLGGTDAGWIKFVNGARESIEAFCDEHKDMLNACLEGDFDELQRLVEKRMNAGKIADGVKFEPVGEKATGFETIESEALA